MVVCALALLTYQEGSIVVMERGPVKWRASYNSTRSGSEVVEMELGSMSVSFSEVGQWAKGMGVRKDKKCNQTRSCTDQESSHCSCFGLERDAIPAHRTGHSTPDNNRVLGKGGMLVAQTP